MIAYHFTAEKLRDGRALPAIGEWLTHDGTVEMCVSGLHASFHPMDALQYAPGELLHLVECEDVVAEEDDKFVCRRRKIIKSIDATELLWSIARWSALQVIHLWDAPDVVKKFLQTGDESLRAAARAAALDAAWYAPDVVKKFLQTGDESLRATAQAAAWEATWAAARDAARATAQAAAWDAAWDAARAAAQATAQAAVQAAVQAAAWDAARDAAWDAAWDAHKKEFKRRVDEEFAK